eukprot:11178395-Lingulodinium_polyedra.AAC.1
MQRRPEGTSAAGQHQARVGEPRLANLNVQLEEVQLITLACYASLGRSDCEELRAERCLAFDLRCVQLGRDQDIGESHLRK